MTLPAKERDDSLLRLEHSVAHQLAEANDIAVALKAVIQALCETEGWDYGRFWHADEAARVMRFSVAWHPADSPIAAHMMASERAVFKPGEGMVGRVWESGQPLWVSDLTKQAHVLSATLAPGLALHGACMFPVTYQGRNLGVMSFVSRGVREPEKRLLQTFRVIGAQVGQFLHRKQREDEVALLNAELEERVRKRTAQLEAANAELEAFAYSIAHDLRSPLTSIDGFTRLLEACDLGQEGEGKARHYLRRVRAGVRQMSELTEAMLSLARLSRVELEYEEVDLAELAARSLGQLREREPERAAKVEMPSHLWARGDPRLLAQVMTNLLGNAWKFSARHPQVSISLGSEKQANETVYWVADQGAGFDMAYASRLFGAFQRLHTPAEFEGTGIGLALVRKIIMAHGGRIWARARPDEGATFYFTLPGD